MTIPQGTPDYQGIAQWRGPIQEAISTTATFPTPWTTTQDCTNFASTVVEILGPTVPVQVTLSYLTEAAGGLQLNQHLWDLLAGQDLSVILPNESNAFVLAVVPGSAGTAIFSVIVAPTNTPATKPQYMVDGNELQANGVSVGASGGYFQHMPQVQPGDGLLIYQDGSGSGKLQFQLTEINAAGATVQFIYFVATVTDTLYHAFPFQAGQYPLQLGVQNNDAAAAHTFTARLSVLPR